MVKNFVITLKDDAEVFEDVISIQFDSEEEYAEFLDCLDENIVEFVYESYPLFNVEIISVKAI